MYFVTILVLTCVLERLDYIDNDFKTVLHFGMLSWRLLKYCLWWKPY